MKRVLDKVRFVRSYPKIGGYKKYNEHMGAAGEQVGKGGFQLMHEPHQTIFYMPYKGKHEGTGLRLSFGSNAAGAYIAIECTPHKLTDDEWFDVRGNLTAIFGGPEVVAKKFRLFEVELAVDIPQPMDDFIFVVPKFRAENLAMLKMGQLEIGSKGGNRWVRIYDKRKQLAEAKGVKIDHPLTRIEFVRRRLKFTLATVMSMPNPFGEILVVPRQQIRQIQKQHPTDYVFGHFARKVTKGATGQTAYLDVEDADMRKVVRKRLEPYSLNLAGKKAEWDAWIVDELGILKDKFKPM
jgi:hypothetical protein